MASTYTFDEDLVSDLYKDVYGTRTAAKAWPSTGENELKQRTWDSLLKSLEENITAARLAEAQAKLDFEKKIEKNLSLGATNRRAAIRWILQAHGCTKLDCPHDTGYTLWKLNVIAFETEYFAEIHPDT